MSTTTYSIGRVIAQALRKLTLTEAGKARLRHLEDGHGTAEDLETAENMLLIGGRADLARELRCMLEPSAVLEGDSIDDLEGLTFTDQPSHPEAVRALRDCSDALESAFAEWEAADVAMSDHNGASDMEAYEDACRLSAAERAYQQAIVDHARAVADLAIAQADQLAAVAADVRAIRAHLEAGR